MADPSYAFARRPRWLVAHTLVLGLVVLMVNLGLWQLRRLDERRARNDLVEARTQVDPVPVADLPADSGEARFRAVVAAGRYASDGTTSLRATQDGVPGGWVFSLLDLGDGDSVVVLRGFVVSEPDGSVPEPAPPAGDVEVEGVAITTDRLERAAETAVHRLEEAAPGALPVIVQAVATEPPDAPDVLTPVPVADLGEGPHLSYAVQWFLFSAVAVVSYPFLLRREARRGG